MPASDSRFPHLIPVDHALPGLSVWDQRSARSVGEAVARRTGTNCYFNITSGRLLWVYGEEPHGGPLSVEFRRPEGCRRYADHEVDDMVRYIGMGRIGRGAKDRIAENQKRAEEGQKEQEHGRFLEGNRRNAEDYAAHLSRKRRGVATVIAA